MNVAEVIQRYRDARGLSQGDLGKLVGCTQQNIRKIESGTTKRSSYIGRILDVLEVPNSERPDAYRMRGSSNVIDASDAFGQPPARLPIYAAAEGGDGAMIVTYEAIDYETRPASLATARGAYGIYIVGDSMSPRYEPGDKALIDPNRPAWSGDDVVLFQLRADNEAVAMIKRLVRVTKEHWHLKQFNPAREFTVERKLWVTCHVVVGSLNRR